MKKRTPLTGKQKFFLGQAIQRFVDNVPKDLCPVSTTVMVDDVAKFYRALTKDKLPEHYSAKQIREVAKTLEIELEGIVEARQNAFATHVQRLAELEKRVAQLEALLK